MISDNEDHTDHVRHLCWNISDGGRVARVSTGNLMEQMTETVDIQVLHGDHCLEQDDAGERNA